MTYQDQLFLRKHGQIERLFAVRFNRVLANQYRQLAKLFIQGKQLEDIDITPLERLYKQMYLYVMRVEGYETWKEYVQPITGQRVNKKDITDIIAESSAPDDPKEMQGFWANLMQTYLNIYIVQRVREVTQTTIKRVTEAIERQRNGGLTDKEIERYLQGEARAQELRANTISRTETTNSISKAQLLSLESSGLNYEKAWHAIKDERTRDAHYATDPKVFIPIKDNFIIGGYQMSYPGDSSQGSPLKNFVNCRCRLTFRLVGSNVGFRPTVDDRYRMI